MTQASEIIDSSDEKRASRASGRLALLLLLTGILLLLGWLGIKGWRLYQTASSLQARQAQIERLQDGGWRQADPDEIEALVLGLRSDVQALGRELGFVMPYLPALSSLPQVGPLAAAAPPLLEMADAGTEAAAYAVRGLKPAVAQLQAEEGSISQVPALLQALDSARPDLARAALSLERAAAARARVSGEESLPWRVRTLLEQGDRWLPLGEDFLRLSLVLPDMMGLYGPRRYLVLAQNQDELRPSGGFISGAGYLEVEDGEIVRLDFADAYYADAWQNDEAAGGLLAKPYSEPPQPLADFMLLDLFLFRDANFWPDFAVSGQKAMDLYAYGRDVPELDGAIGLNQGSLQLLLQGLGPVTIPESGQTVNGNNVIESLQDAWSLQEGVQERKAFLGPFAAAILRRLEESMSSIDPLNLAQKLAQALEQKDLQLYMRDRDAAAVLAANDWDGRLAVPQGHDALMIVDSNMGYNKANYFIDRSAVYDVHLLEDGSGQATLSVTHQHRGQPTDEACRQGVAEEYRAGADYRALTDKCYWNYLRIYTPAGSELVSGPQHLIEGETWFGGYDWQPAAQTLSELPGYTTFDSWMVVAQGESIDSAFSYLLPATITQQEDDVRRYTLRLLKQSGVSPHVVQIRVTPPPDSEIVSAFPEPVAREDGTVVFAVDLDSDRTVSLSYR